MLTSKTVFEGVEIIMVKFINLKNKLLNWLKDNYIVLFPMAVGAFLYVFLISKIGYGNEYYAATVKSMMQSFKNFFFASFDPGGFVTVDKPPLGFWIQALFCFIFGYSGISLIMPQIIAAILNVLLVYIIVKRYFGKTSAFFAALFLATTPIYTAIARNNTIDMLMILTCIVSIYFALKAIEKSSLKLFLISVFIVGLGFNIKMLQAWIVAPGIFLGYLLFANKNILKRLAHLLIAAVIFLVSSLWWCIAVDLTPSEKRPYMGSSQTNSALELALSYNGIQRFLPSNMNITDIINSILHKTSKASQSQTFQSNSSFGFGFGQNANPMGAREGGSAGILRLFNEQMAGQISWVLVAAIIGFFALIILSILLLRKNKMIAGFTTIWGMWFLLLFIYFSFTRGLFHIYYLATMAPSIAVFAGIGVGFVFDKVRVFSTPYLKVVGVFILLATAAYQIYTVYRYQDSTNYWPVFAIGFAAVLGITALSHLKVSKGVTIASFVLAAIFLCAMPFYWSLSCSLYPGNAVIPSAGNPLNRSTMGAGPGLGWRFGAFDNQRQDNNNLGGRPDFAPPSDSNSNSQSSTPPDQNNNQNRSRFSFGAPRGNFGGERTADNNLINFLLKNNTGEKYILAVVRATEAAPIIIKTGKAVMAMGGFSGNDPILTVEKLKEMIKNGEVKYFELSGGFGRFGFGQDGINSEDISSWIMEHGELVNSDYNIWMVDKNKI